MSRYNQGTLIVSSSPHVLDNTTTSRIMLDVIIALVPAFIMSGVIFGSKHPADNHLCGVLHNFRMGF